jgi:chromosome segregation ATPase
MNIKKYEEIRLDFTIYADDDHMPDAQGLSNGINDGLPEEWFNGDGDYEIIAIRFGKFEDTDEKDTDEEDPYEKASQQGTSRTVQVLESRLTEQDKLIAHLERRHDNLVDRKRNLIEKNDNQVEIIKDLNRRIESQKEDIRRWRKLTDELRAQVAHLEEYNSDANVKLLAEVDDLEAKLEEVESHRDYLLEQGEDTEVKKLKGQLDEMEWNRKYYKNRSDELFKSNQAVYQVNTDQATVIQDQKLKVASLKSRLDDALLSYETAAKERDQFKEENSNQHKAIIDQVRVIGTLTDRIDKKRSVILDLEEEFKRLNAEKVKSVGITDEEYERVRHVISEAINRVGQARIEDSTGALDNLFEEVNDALKELPAMDERDLGWGDDDQLANLEGSLDDLRISATELSDTIIELGDTLNEIRTGR